MEMIDKVKKYLLRHDQINIYKKNESGSEYFRVGNSIIRVSDHVATSRNDPDTLNIVVSGDNFIVMFGNKIINVNDYNAFKSFLKYHIQMCDCFKDIINKGLGRQSKDYIAKEKKKKALPTVSLKTKVTVSPHDPRLEGLTAKQIDGLVTMLFNSEIAAAKTINVYRKQKGLPLV